MTAAGEPGSLLIASVTAIFRGAGGVPVAPAAVADALMATDGVVTVRVGEDGSVSVFRVDVPATSPQDGVDAAAAVAGRIADEHRLELDVVGVVLTTDDERHEVLRIGTPADGQT